MRSQTFLCAKSNALSKMKNETAAEVDEIYIELSKFSGLRVN